MYTYLYAFTKILFFSPEHGDVQTSGLNSTITSATGKATTTARTSTPAATTTTGAASKHPTSSTTNPTAAADATNAA